LLVLGDESCRRFTELEAGLADFYQFAAQQHKEGVTVTSIEEGSDGHLALDMPLQSQHLEGIKHLSPRARDIYFQLKTAVVIRAARSV
jgi:hypothetical protein